MTLESLARAAAYDGSIVSREGAVMDHLSENQMSPATDPMCYAEEVRHMPAEIR